MKYTYTEEDREFARKNYYTMTSGQIAEEIGCSRSWVLSVWVDSGLSGKDNGRKYYSNFDYFEKIDSVNKAYVLGLISADGVIHRKKNKDQGVLRLSLSEKDKKILKEILKDMESDNPISEYKRNKEQVYSNFAISSQKMYDDLIKLGIKERKTWDLDLEKVLNNVPEKYIGSFLRGYFDGDGCISLNKKRPYPSGVSVSISGPESILSIIRDVSIKKIGIYPSFSKDKRKNKYSKNLSAGTLMFKNTTEKYLFLKYIYRDIELELSNLMLDRKKELANSFFHMVESNITNKKFNIRAVELFNSKSWRH